jgi:hypothetical protein
LRLRRADRAGDPLAPWVQAGHGGSARHFSHHKDTHDTKEVTKEVTKVKALRSLIRRSETQASRRQVARSADISLNGFLRVLRVFVVKSSCAFGALIAARGALR